MSASMDLPTGPAVTFLFTDIEGSTRLERAVGSVVWAAIAARHDALLRSAIEGHGGAVVKTEGDAFFAAFSAPAAAATAAVAAQRAIAAEAWPEGSGLRIRMGLHIGEGRLRPGVAPGEPQDYVGIDVNYTARIAAAGNGGQIVLSDRLVAALLPALPDVVGLEEADVADEGLRAVKDFEEPARLHRLVVPGAADDARPLRTIEAPSNLPGEVTALVGREGDIDILGQALTASRIVTLTGPGGSGKTRLALGVARVVRDRFPHGAWFVDLAAARDAALLESAIAATLGVRESPERPIPDALRAHLRDRTVLLLLDNLEQLLPAVAMVVSGLVQSAPDLRILVTSRELLRIAGERGYPVPPLDVASGVALFEDRARSHRPDLVLSDEARTAIRSICERLGGLPLAIELAAARVRILSPGQILERLTHSLDLAGGARDVPERQRTLRGAIDWSHDLLSEAEQRLFRRLAVFAGGWTPDTARLVADPQADLGIDLDEGLLSLADKSLIRIEPGAPAGDDSPDEELRFGLHPLLREYALERLSESGERPEVEARHAAVSADIAETAGRSIFKDQTNLRRLDREDHNLRAAIAWSLANDDPALGLRIMGAVWRWFQQRARIREGRVHLALLLPRSSKVDVRLRIAGLAAEGGLAYWMEDFVGAQVAYEERLSLASGTGDDVLLADAHYDLGFLSVVGQDETKLREHEQRALDLYTAAGRPDGAMRARQALVLGVFLAGDYPGARDLEMVNLQEYRAAGSLALVADSLVLQSAIHFRLGEPATSWQRLVEGLRTFAANGDASGSARSLGMAAIIQLLHGDPEFGARVAGATYVLVREMGLMLAPVKVLHLPDPGELAAEHFGAARAGELLAVGAATPLSEVIAEVLAAPAPAATGRPSS